MKCPVKSPHRHIVSSFLTLELTSSGLKGTGRGLGLSFKL